MELASLIGRLNPDNRRALERAAQRCLQRGHHFVEIEHLLLELLDIEGGDLAFLLPRFGLGHLPEAEKLHLKVDRLQAAKALKGAQDEWEQTIVQTRLRQVAERLKASQRED